MGRACSVMTSPARRGENLLVAGGRIQQRSHASAAAGGLSSALQPPPRPWPVARWPRWCPMRCAPARPIWTAGATELVARGAEGVMLRKPGSAY